MTGGGRGQTDADEIAAIRDPAERGLAEYECDLGYRYQVGDGMTKDLVQAESWYRKAAEQGHSPAQLLLAMLLAGGIGIPKNEFEAAKWFKKAAAQKNVMAYIHLADMYEFGRGVRRDYAAALDWLYRYLDDASFEARPRKERGKIERRIKALNALTRPNLEDDGPELFVTDKDGNRWYFNETKSYMRGLGIAWIVALAALFCGMKFEISLLKWSAFAAVVYIPICFAFIVPRYFEILRERSYRARDRFEAHRLRPVQRGVLDQQPHGASADEGTI
jgi:hypothetical protein